MAHPKLCLAIREVLVTLEAARNSAPSIVAAGRLDGIIRELRELSISLEPDLKSHAGQPVASPVIAARRLADIIRNLRSLSITLEPDANLPPQR
jgi:hypothetical protein